MEAPEKTMNNSRKEIIVAAIAIVVTVAASVWIWRTQFAAPPINLALHQGVGRRLAEETARALEQKGRIVLVTLRTGASPVVDAQLRAFKQTLTKWPEVKIAGEDKVDTEKSSKYGAGAGMSARRFLRLSEKFKDAGAIVSLIGAPDPDDLKTTNNVSHLPRLIAVSRSHKKLMPLLQQGTIASVIVPRFAFPAPGPETPRTPAEWFENRFQVVAGRGTEQ
jgi:hypothetical protein